MPRSHNPEKPVKFLLRLSPALHRELKRFAQERRVPVSLHYEILERLWDSVIADLEELKERVEEGARERKMAEVEPRKKKSAA
jgi:hypothetical protein